MKRKRERWREKGRELVILARVWQAHTSDLNPPLHLCTQCWFRGLPSGPTELAMGDMSVHNEDPQPNAVLHPLRMNMAVRKAEYAVRGR